MPGEMLNVTVMKQYMQMLQRDADQRTDSLAVWAGVRTLFVRVHGEHDRLASKTNPGRPSVHPLGTLAAFPEDPADQFFDTAGGIPPYSCIIALICPAAVHWAVACLDMQNKCWQVIDSSVRSLCSRWFPPSVFWFVTSLLAIRTLSAAKIQSNVPSHLAFRVLVAINFIPRLTEACDTQRTTVPKAELDDRVRCVWMPHVCPYTCEGHARIRTCNCTRWRGKGRHAVQGGDI